MDRDQSIASELDSVVKGGNLFELAEKFKQEGMGQKEMYDLFDSFRAQHEGDADETKYNALLDTMDLISGQCNPKNSLFGEKELILWEERSVDDCVAELQGLFLHVEQMDGNFWWWAVTDEKRDQIDSSDNYETSFKKKKQAKEAAERAAFKHLGI